MKKGRTGMLRLDHFVIHIDADMGRLETLQQHIAPLGYPFAPQRGKGTRGFKVANLWIGEQYYEMVWLRHPDGRGWRADWVTRYNQGQRGIICVMLLTDQLDQLYQQFQELGLPLDPPERIHYPILGVLRKSMPWRNLYLGPISNTDLFIGFQQMDNAQYLEDMKDYMVPNASSNGMLGIRAAAVQHAWTSEAWTFLRAAFPQAQLEEHQLVVPLDEGQRLAFVCTDQSSRERVHVRLQSATIHPEYAAQSFRVENVELWTVGEKDRDAFISRF
jgi:hypothetical protein